MHFSGWQRINAGVANHPRKMGRQNILEGEELTGLRAVHQNSDRIYQMRRARKTVSDSMVNGDFFNCFSFISKQKYLIYLGYVVENTFIGKPYFQQSQIANMAFMFNG